MLDRMAQLNVISARARPQQAEPQRPRPQGQPRPATAASRRPRRSSATTPSSYLLADPAPRQDRRRPPPAALQRRPDHQDHRRPALPARGRRRGRRATSTRPTRRSAPSPWSSPAPARSGRSPSRGRWAATRRRARPTSTTSCPQKYGDSNGFQAGSTFKAFVLAAAISQGIPLSTQINSPQTITIPENRYRDCDGHYLASTDVWSPAELHRRRHLRPLHAAPSSR